MGLLSHELRNPLAAITITLPLDEPVPDPALDLPLGASRVHQRVVLIEDNPDAAETLREVLVLRGCDVAVADDGMHGIELVHEMQPTALICDLGLPGMSGYDVARALRSNQQSKSMLMIALSGYGGPVDMNRSREAGFDVHLVKPPNFDALERILSTTQSFEARATDRNT